MLLKGSHAAELAIRAAIHLALQPPGKLSPIRHIAAGTGLPPAYLAKIMRLLIRAGLVRAFRGPGGGVELGRPPDQISLSALVRAVEGESPAERCILGMGTCSESQPCLLHSQWVPLRAEYVRLLEETSLAMLVRAAQAKRGPVSAPARVPRRMAPRWKSNPKASKRKNSI